MLREVNHRIKNSQQIVSSILNLQSTHLENTDAVQALQSASARVNAIAAVHERLYTGNGIGVVALDEFLARLCANIGDAHGHGELDVDLAPLELSTDAAIPLALVVNELLTRH